LPPSLTQGHAARDHTIHILVRVPAAQHPLCRAPSLLTKIRKLGPTFKLCNSAFRVLMEPNDFRNPKVWANSWTQLSTSQLFWPGGAGPYSTARQGVFGKTSVYQMISVPVHAPQSALTKISSHTTDYIFTTPTSTLTYYRIRDTQENRTHDASLERKEQEFIWRTCSAVGRLSNCAAYTAMQCA
jgi:hypothetical protein